MRNYILIGFAGLLLTASPDRARAQESDRPIVRFGIVMDGPWAGNDGVRSLFEREITELLQGEFDPRFPPEKRRIADWTLDGVRSAVDELLTDAEVDFLLAMGPAASHVAALRPELEKPTLGAFVLDAELQGLPQENGGSGVPNLSYVSIPLAVQRDLEAFQQVAQFNRLVYLANPHFMDAAPGLADRLQEVAVALGIELAIVRAEPPAEATLGAIADDTEAVYVAPLLHFPQAEWDRLIAGLNGRRLPTFSALGSTEVERGMLASLSTEDFFPRVARRTALNVQRMLLGEDGSGLPVAFASGERLTINMATARATGAFPSWTVLTEADLLNEEVEDVARTVSLGDAVREALEVNLDLGVADRRVAAGGEDIRRARSVLLPQVDVFGSMVFIDEDRANASFGSQPQRRVVGGAGLTQVIYSEPARADVSIQRDLQTTRLLDREELSLDVALETSVAYLILLQAKTAERIQMDNLRVTRSNLELSRVRQTVGSSGPAEVYRWEAQLATDRIAVLTAQAARFQLELQLNRILDRPLEEPFGTVDTGMDDPELLVSDDRLRRHVDNPALYRVFRDFMVSEGLARTPELRNLEAGISAQERAYRSRRAAFWAPTVALRTDLTSTLAKGGAGSELDLAFPPGSPDLGAAFPRANDFNWSLGIEASFPLFQGGERIAERTQAGERLQELRTRYDAASQRIEQRIRNVMQGMRSSFPSMRLAADAADAAGRNLEVVSDAYGRGLASVLDLLDAQNASVVAELGAANSVYAFLIDLMELQRATGGFDFFLTAEQREDFFQRMEAFFAEAGQTPTE